MPVNTQQVNGLCEAGIRFMGFGQDAQDVRSCVELYSNKPERLAQFKQVLRRVFAAIKGAFGESEYKRTRKIIATRLSKLTPTWATYITGQKWIDEKADSVAGLVFRGLVKANESSLDAGWIARFTVDRGLTLDKAIEVVTEKTKKAAQAAYQAQINKVAMMVFNMMTAQMGRQRPRLAAPAA